MARVSCLAAQPIPPPSCPFPATHVQLEAAKEALEEAIAAFSVFPSAFWALLIVLPVILLVPLSAARAYAPGMQGLFVQMAGVSFGGVCPLLLSPITSRWVGICSRSNL